MLSCLQLTCTIKTFSDGGYKDLEYFMYNRGIMENVSTIQTGDIVPSGMPNPRHT